jgi:isocitrate dehydrogenase kinase/phosphatase
LFPADLFPEDLFPEDLFPADYADKKSRRLRRWFLDDYADLFPADYADKKTADFADGSSRIISGGYLLQIVHFSKNRF